MKSFPSWQLRKLIGDLPAAVIPAGFLKFPYLSSCLYPPPFPGPLASNILYILSDFCHLGWFPLVASQRLPHLHVLQGFCAQPVTLLLISVSLNPVNFIITISWIWLCFFFFPNLYVCTHHLNSKGPKVSNLTDLLLIAVLCSTELLEINAKTKQKWKLIWSLKALISICWPRGWRPECSADVNVSLT